MNPNVSNSVSVVIPTHNYGRFIGAALDSALAQEGVAEIIVVDDGSTDETEAVLRRYPNIRHLWLEARGAAAARNAGWHECRGDIVCFLDADDWWLPGKVRAQLDLLNLHPEYGLVYCDTYRVDEVGRRLARWSDSKPPVYGQAFWEQLVMNRIQTSTVAIRRAVLDETGGFDESLTAWEDIDLWLRVTTQHPIGYVPDILACYRMHGISLSARALDMAGGELRCLEKVGGRLGITGDPRFREALANAQIHVGTAHYLLGDMRVAREWIHMGWSTDPRGLIRERSAETFGKTLLGRTLTTWLRRVRYPTRAL